MFLVLLNLLLGVKLCIGLALLISDLILKPFLHFVNYDIGVLELISLCLMIGGYLSLILLSSSISSSKSKNKSFFTVIGLSLVNLALLYSLTISDSYAYGSSFFCSELRN